MTRARTLALALLVLAPGALAQTPHTDWKRETADDDAVVEVARHVLARAGASWASALQRDEASATRSSAEARFLAHALRAAAEDPTHGVETTPALARLATPAGALADATPLLVESLAVLSAREAPAPFLAAALDDATTALAEANAALDALERERIPVERERAALQAVAREVEEYALPPWDGSLVLLVAPADASFGALVRAIASRPATGGEAVELHGFDRFLVSAPFRRSGIAVTTFRVPWDVPAGEHEVEARVAGATATATLNVTLVPASWRDARIPAPRADRVLAARLVDARGAGIAGAEVSWGYGSLEERAATDATGTLALATGKASAPALRVVFEGNATHAPALATFPDRWYVPPDPVRLLFEDAGFEGPPTRPSLPAGLLALVAAVTIAAAAAEVALSHRARVSRAHSARSARDPAQAPAPRAQPARVAPAHPLLAALDRAGHASASLTLREAIPLWESLGAPRVREWARAHERAVFAGGPPAPIPPDLEAWAARRAREST